MKIFIQEKNALIHINYENENARKCPIFRFYSRLSAEESIEFHLTIPMVKVAVDSRKESALTSETRRRIHAHEDKLKE